MDWIERLNGAILYIEEHLTEELDLEQIAKIACCSSYHFQRMFAYMADIPLSEYVRRRRMSLAAVDLQASSAKVIDIALKYGYQSPTAFNRAFKNIHGIAPSAVQKEGICVKAYPPISFKMTIKGACEMEYRIEKKEAFRIVGISTPLEKEIEKNFESVPKLWQKSSMDGTLGKLAGLIGEPPAGLLGVSACIGDDDWEYYIAVATNAPAEGFKEYTVPAATWAVFPNQGPISEMQNFEKSIVTDWLPTSGYEYTNTPDVEVYIEPNPMNAKYEVWIPVVKVEK